MTRWFHTSRTDLRNDRHLSSCITYNGNGTRSPQEHPPNRLRQLPNPWARAPLLSGRALPAPGNCPSEGALGSDIGKRRNIDYGYVTPAVASGRR